MRNHVAVLIIALLAFAADARAVTIAWSLVGDPGNAPDTSSYAGVIPATNAGAVAYSFNIGTYDVTNNQYVEFLNTKDPTGANAQGLYNTNMSVLTGQLFGGIAFSPSNPDGSKYSSISGRENWPVSNVNWYDAARFTNWQNNGQGNGSTETGAYTLLGGTPTPSNGTSITRNPGASVFLPSADEWYKAAYYNPGTSSYYVLPTSSNTPTTASGPTALANYANYSGDAGSTELVKHYGRGPLMPTDVGAYTGTTSPYGAYDMGGNVWQWIESTTLIGTALNRDIRGGYFGSSLQDMASFSTGPEAFPPAWDTQGFRVASIASVPEPSTGVLAALALLGLAALALRR